MKFNVTQQVMFILCSVLSFKYIKLNAFLFNNFYIFHINKILKHVYTKTGSLKSKFHYDQFLVSYLNPSGINGVSTSYTPIHVIH